MALAAGCIRQPDAMTCPTGIYCPAGAKCAARQAACIFDDCGDGKLQAGEACDDGNKIDGDGCSADCMSSETCGNRIVDSAVGEVCDDGNNVDGDGCSADCRSTGECGNAKVDLGEECDPGKKADGTVSETASCDADCTLMRHGDGTVNATAGEECDGGVAGVSTDCQSAACNANCTVSRHGDGWVNPLDGEACDGDGLGHGNGADCESATCNASCTWSRCGDGIPNATAGEQCDDGNTSDQDDCVAGCRINTCGDGYVDLAGPSRREACDLGARATSDPLTVLRNGDKLCPYGMTSCVGCATDCGSISTPSPQYCGDGAPQSPEECDGLYSFACGTCSSTCRYLGANPATGSITVASTAVTDGASLTIDDGTNAFTIEFDTGTVAGCQATASACVAVPGDATTSSIATAIENATTGWALTVTVTRSSSEISLQNTAAGVAGNIPLTTTGTSVVVAPAQGAVVVSGMAGGTGCPIGGLCGAYTDCVSGKCNDQRHVCAKK